MTGEVGTGKTTMVHALLNSLGDDVQCVYLSNPLFTVNEFMDYLAFGKLFPDKAEKICAGL